MPRCDGICYLYWFWRLSRLRAVVSPRNPPALHLPKGKLGSQYKRGQVSGGVCVVVEDTTEAGIMEFEKKQATLLPVRFRRGESHRTRYHHGYLERRL